MLKKTLFSVLIFSLSLTLSLSGVFAMPSVRYLLRIQTQSANCIVYINGMEAVSNVRTESGTIITGFDITPFVENGDNDLNVWFGPAGEQAGTYNFTTQSSCIVTIEAQRGNKTLALSNITIEASNQSMPTAEKSAHYSGSNITSKVTEGKLPNFNAYRAKRTFTLKEVPEWAWTTATPFTATSQNIHKLQDAYMDMWLAIKKHKLIKVKELMRTNVKECSSHEDISEELFYKTYDFIFNFEKIQPAGMIDFSKYSVVSYRNGKLIQLLDENDKPPLRMIKTEGKTKSVRYYNPYFSLINGKIIITR